MNTKFLVLAAMTLGVSNFAQAEVFVCHQTEPFLTTTYDTEKGTAKTVDQMNNVKPTVTRGLKFIVKDAGKFEFRLADGSVLKTLVLNQQGSDGLSDLNYPFDGGQGINGPIGCESSELKAANSNDK